MFQLLNRITWVLSLVIGWSISYLIVGIYDQAAALILGLFFAFGVKYVLFSPNYIRGRLSFFQEKLLEPLQFQSQQREIVTDTPEQLLRGENEERTEKIQQEHEELLEENTRYRSKNHIVETSAVREPGIIAKFFSENLLAKLGGILVFLGVLFFLSLVYTAVGPVTKLIIGFSIGFLLFASGAFLDKKGYTNESRIVMGVSILVNYLVILGGRYLLEGGDGYLAVGTTFVFLILNTLFAVMTSLVYNSRTLLVFAFAFAYLNPLLLGESSTEPYTLLGYTMIVTLGALFLSYKKKDEILFPLAFICASVLLLGAPWSDSNGWIAKLLCINTLGALSLYVSTAFEKKYQYVHELLIGGTFFLIGIMGFLGMSSLSLLQLAILSFSILTLMLFCYITSKKGGYLYSIGTLGSVLTLSPALFSVLEKQEFFLVSWVLVGLFFILNIGFTLLSAKNFLVENIVNIVGGVLSGALFITYIIYASGNIYFPGILQGFAYLILACSYGVLAFFSVQKIGIEEVKQSENAKNVFYALSAIAISFFTLAVAFVFSEQKEIVSLVWLLESAILFFLMTRTQSSRVGFAALVLFTIGVLRLTPFLFSSIFGSSYMGDFGFLAALLMTLGVFVFILYCISPRFQKNTAIYFSLESYGTHHVLHTVGILTLSILIYTIFDIQDDWYSLLYISVILCVLNFIYYFFQIQGLKNIFVCFLGLAFLSHLSLFLDTIGTQEVNLYLSLGAFAIFTLPYIYIYLAEGSIKDKIQLSLYLLYTFFLSTFTVYHIFEVTFAITLFWGILSFILLGSGIKRDILPLRTLGLYLIVLTAGKVFFYDIWMSVDDVISRVVALIVVGILMIILSTMYTKKYGNTLNREFSPENIFGKQGKTQIEHPQAQQELDIIYLLKNTDIDDIVGVRMHIYGEQKPIQIRAKNLIKIAKIIEQKFGKTVFEPGELRKISTNFSATYVSALPKNQYEKISEIVEQFVLKGGKIEFVKNS